MSALILLKSLTITTGLFIGFKIAHWEDKKKRKAKMIKCPKCKSTEITAFVLVRANALVYINNPHEVDPPEYDCFEWDREYLKFEEKNCENCGHGWL
jgi:ribosomal protein S27AE